MNLVNNEKLGTESRGFTTIQPTTIIDFNQGFSFPGTANYSLSGFLTEYQLFRDISFGLYLRKMDNLLLPEHVPVRFRMGTFSLLFILLFVAIKLKYHLHRM